MMPLIWTLTSFYKQIELINDRSCRYMYLFFWVTILVVDIILFMLDKIFDAVINFQPCKNFTLPVNSNLQTGNDSLSKIEAICNSDKTLKLLFLLFFFSSENWAYDQELFELIKDWQKFMSQNIHFEPTETIPKLMFSNVCGSKS